jgi:hypothetical protein
MERIKNIIQHKLKEMNATSQGGASFNSGEGVNYATPFAFKKKGKSKNNKIKGYSLVPDEIEGSGLEVKELYEAKLTDFQEERIAAFDDIETHLNALSPLVSNAKNDTIAFYNEHPGSYDIYKPTEMILSYLKNIETLLTQTK